MATQGEFPQELQWTLSFAATIDSSELHKPGQVNCQELTEVHRIRATAIFIPFLDTHTKCAEQAALGADAGGKKTPF